MKAGEKNYLKESNGTKANCNANVTQVLKVTHIHFRTVLRLLKGSETIETSIASSQGFVSRATGVSSIAYMILGTHQLFIIFLIGGLC